MLPIPLFFGRPTVAWLAVRWRGWKGGKEGVRSTDAMMNCEFNLLDMFSVVTEKSPANQTLDKSNTKRVYTLWKLCFVFCVVYKVCSV